MQLSPQKAEFLRRQAARTSFESWCRECGYEPALHHRLVIKEIEDIVKGRVAQKNLMILMPPGSAKSTYTSKCFPPWFLAQQPDLAILACSHSAELANDFGRAGRNLVEANSRTLGYTLKRDSRAADSWEVTNGGYYRAAGCGAGIAGRRADLGLIDDFCGTDEDARSKTFNDKIWNWYVNDFVPRLKPNAVRILIANHRNEDDLVGRLLEKEANKWRVIRLRLLIETEEQAVADPLGRKVGEYLWPEFFTKELVEERMQNVSASGIEQQEPSPEKGAFFEKAWFEDNEYKSLNDLAGGQVYGASDHAVSEAQTADNSCLGLGVWKDGLLYIHPDIAWDRMGPQKTVDEWIRLGKTYKPLTWWAEKGQISKSLFPFLAERMQNESAYFTIQQVTPSKDKMTRAQSIRGMMQMGLVKWPAFAPWYQRARREMLFFPNGKHDDFVDFVAHLGRGIHMMTGGAKKVAVTAPLVQESGFNITPRIIKEQAKRDKRLHILSYIDR